jgi:restriction system protein
MTDFYRIILGRGSSLAEKCFEEGFVGVDFDIDHDISEAIERNDNWRAFNREYIPIWLEKNPGKSKIAAGLAMGSTWVVTKGMQTGDFIISPDGNRRYRFGKVIGPYEYVWYDELRHRRPVLWTDNYVSRDDLSEQLQSFLSYYGTVSKVRNYSEELEKFAGISPIGIPSETAPAESTNDFRMEKHLEDFLVANWERTNFAEEYNLYKEEGTVVGQQYPTDTGPLDILAVSKDGKKLLVIELKKSRASDSAVGQVLRYMAYIQEEIAESYQAVVGAIIALDEDKKLMRAVSMIPTVDFYRYSISFSLTKV